MKIEQVVSLIASATIVVWGFVLSNKLSTVEANVNTRIEKTIKSLMPKPDTARRPVAPKMQSKGTYYYFDGIANGKSKRWIDVFQYDVDFPTELQEGYITPAVENNGARYYIWSQNEITRGTPIVCWGIADAQKFEIGHNPNPQDKIYSYVLYPLVGVRKQLSTNP